MIATGSTINPWIAICISLLAALVAGTALWRTHLQGPKLLAAPGTLGFAVFPVRSSGETWYILSAATTLTLTNAGARPGLISAVQLDLRFVDLTERQQYCPLQGRFVVVDPNPKLWDGGRFSWLEGATRMWRPHALLPKESITETVVFERRIDEPVVGRLEVRLRAFRRRSRLATSRSWTTLAMWDYNLSAQLFSELAVAPGQHGYWVTPRGAPETSEDTSPPNLLEKVRVAREDLPAVANRPPSFLDYPPDNAPDAE